MSMDRIPLSKLAQDAYKDREAELERRRMEAERVRKEAELQRDEETMEWVRIHPWVRKNIPHLDLKLVSRSFPQKTAVFCTVDEPEILLAVTEGQTDRALLINKDAKQPLVGARTIRELADLGRYLYEDRVRASERESAS